MQAIAAENNLSETAFLVPEGEGYGLRWFTPNVEVDLCGHATLAAAFVVFEELKPGTDSVAFQTLSGGLTVARDGEALVMDFPGPAREPGASACGAGAGTWRDARRSARRRGLDRGVRERGSGGGAQPRSRRADRLGPARGRGDRAGRRGRRRLRAALLRAQERRARGPGDRQRADGAGALLGGTARQATPCCAPAFRPRRANGLRGSGASACLDRGPRGALHGRDDLSRD